MIQRRLLLAIIGIASAAAAIPAAFLALQNETSVGAPAPEAENPPAGNLPMLNDSSLAIELAIEGLDFPTSFAFLDDDTILVLEKGGAVRAIVDWVLQEEPLLEIPVRADGERGLLGVAVADAGGQKSVFLYLTEVDEENEPRNRIYRYDWQSGSLANPRMILDLPATPGLYHNGGKMVIGPDGYLYASMGYLNNKGMLQNYVDGPPPDDTGVIFRIDFEGRAAEDNPLSSDDPEVNEKLSKYYAYGVRNSFGMAFDPVTDVLWITDNGAIAWDEIHVVKPGFNGGWDEIRGPLSRLPNPNPELVEFEGSYYGEPAFSWIKTIGITDIEFVGSDVLGRDYQNNVFVGDVNNGNLYYFRVNDDRTGFVFDERQKAVSDLVAHEGEPPLVTLGTGFGGISEIETGPDGYLYVMSIFDGKIYRIGSAR
jgi:glucose/arabinose dehydrogenase